ncbi:MAG: hypothetical protein M1836_005483 [Candelina mexicana]|nr:MAG: hypothetical protein M1836_005483 [Candelina mexicana]
MPDFDLKSGRVTALPEPSKRFGERTVISVPNQKIGAIGSNYRPNLVQEEWEAIRPRHKERGITVAQRERLIVDLTADTEQFVEVAILG